MEGIELLDDFERETVAMLLDSALSHIWYASTEDAEFPDDIDGRPGCCPACCGTCIAVASLLLDRKLETWLVAPGFDPTKSSTWDDTNNRVDRAWLLRTWSTDLKCHEGVLASEHAVEAIRDRLRVEAA